MKQIVLPIILGILIVIILIQQFLINVLESDLNSTIDAINMCIDMYNEIIEGMNFEEQFP